MIRRFLLVLFLACCSSVGKAADTGKPASLPLVILLGDSIRMNYQSVVTEQLKGRAEVWAPKDNCQHTVYMLANLDRWLEDRQPKVLHLNVGLHDLFLDGKTGKPRHSLETYEANLRAIFTRLQKLEGTRLIFALTTSVNEPWQAASQTYGRVVRHNADIETYNARARAIAEEMGLVVNDLPELMKREGADKILNPKDGIHLSPEGCRILGTEVSRVILKQLHP